MAFLARIRTHSYNTEIAYKQGIRSPREDRSWSGTSAATRSEVACRQYVSRGESHSGAFSDDSGGLRAPELYSARPGSTAFGFWRNGPFTFFGFAILRREAAGNSGRIRRGGSSLVVRSPIRWPSHFGWRNLPHASVNGCAPHPAIWLDREGHKLR